MVTINKGIGRACNAYDCMREKWNLVHDLMGGTLAMRAAGERWLPREEKESAKKYNARLGRSFLFEGYADTVRKIAAKPFTQPVTIEANPELDSRLDPLVKTNADKAGTSLTVFLHDVFRDAVKYGIAHTLVEYPAVPQGATLAYELENKIHPYFVRIDPRDLIYWKPTVDPKTSEQIVTEIRFLEYKTVPKGDFEDEEVIYLRQYSTDTIKVWRFDNKTKEWVLEDTLPNTLGKVPLVTLYTNRTGFMTADPPLEGLAWLNVAHWQSESDQRNILRFARCGVAIFTGVTEDEQNKMGPFIAGADRSYFFTSENVKAQYLEHTGASIAIGQADLDKLEDRMQILGLQPLIESSQRVAATTTVNSEQRSHSNVQSWVEAMTEATTKMFELVYEWLKLPFPEKFKVNIFKDFSLTMKAGLDLQVLLSMREKNEITRETFLREVKRRNVLDDMVDIAQEASKAQAEYDAKQKLLLTPKETNGSQSETD